MPWRAALQRYCREDYPFCFSFKVGRSLQTTVNLLIIYFSAVYILVCHKPAWYKKVNRYWQLLFSTMMIMMSKYNLAFSEWRLMNEWGQFMSRATLALILKYCYAYTKPKCSHRSCVYMNKDHLISSFPTCLKRGMKWLTEVTDCGWFVDVCTRARRAF